MTLKRIAPVSLGKMLGGLYAILGLLGGGLLALAVEGLRSMMMFFPSDFGVEDISPFSTIAVLILPLVYGLIGFVSGALIALVYNWIAKLFGGIELEFEQVEPHMEIDQGASS